MERRFTLETEASSITWLLVALALVALAILAGCAGPDTAPAGTPTAVEATETVEATASPTTAAASPTAQLVETPTAQATGTAAADPTLTVPTGPSRTPSAEPAGNIFASILGGTSAPEGWSVSTCPWQAAPFLCVYIGEEIIGSPEMNIFPLQTHDEFAQMLRDAGLTPGSIDYRNPADEAKLKKALQAFVDNYHRSFEHDRQLTYGGSKTYSRLPTNETRMGALPAVHYGFTITNPDGSVHERWISYAGFDGDLLFIVVAAFYPDDLPGRFRSDAELQQFEPHLTKIVARLQIPLPVEEVSEGDAASITALQEVQMHAAYTIASNNIGPIAKGETRKVTGRSPDGRWWRVECTENPVGNCWVEGDPKLVQVNKP